MKKTDCVCPNTGCPAHGNCKECIAFHKGNPYCQSEETKKLVDGKIARYGIMK
ncbi:hypothetical protein LJC14_02335 [Treponema sp. OttesenSCG-928-L16]|nr:hypothetical protein [Treponema sp. OttesenSCG-928-L16]